MQNEILSIALEEIARAYGAAQVEVAPRPVVHAGISFSWHADAHAAVDAGGNGHIDGFIGSNETVTTAFLAGFFNDGAGTFTDGAGLLDESEKAAALVLEHAASAAMLAGLTGCSFFGSGAVAVRAGYGGMDADLHGGAEEGVFKAEADELLSIFSALGGGRVWAGTFTAEASEAAAEAAAEELVEDIIEVGAMGEVALKVETAFTEGVFHALMPILIVELTLLFIGKNLVGFGCFLELFFSGLIPGVTVGVIFHGQFAVSFFNGIGIGAFFNAEHLIIVAFCCHIRPPLRMFQLKSQRVPAGHRPKRSPAPGAPLWPRVSIPCGTG